MMRLLVVAFFLLGTTSAAFAQNSAPASTDTNQNVAADFAKTSAANPGSLLIAGGPSVTPTAFGNFIIGSWSFLEPGASLTISTTATPAFLTSNYTANPTPAPPPVPRYLHGERDDFRWQLSVGVTLVRLRAPVFNATAVGVTTSVTYFTNDWFALEASVTGAFAPEIFDREHIKYLGYGGGPKIAWRQKRWEPFAHAIFGGAHIIPQLARSSQNGFEIEAGGGTDFRFNPRLSARAEVDWLRTFLYGGSQNSGQATLGLVAHF